MYRFKTMPNAVYGIKLHKCKKPKHYKTWTQLLKRANFTVTANTRVCSNHFKYGQPYDDDPHPTLYLKGYIQNSKPRRRELKRPIELSTISKSCKKVKRRKVFRFRNTSRCRRTSQTLSKQHWGT